MTPAIFEMYLLIRMPELEGYRAKKGPELYAINENGSAPSTYVCILIALFH